MTSVAHGDKLPPVMLKIKETAREEHNEYY